MDEYEEQEQDDIDDQTETEVGDGDEDEDEEDDEEEELHIESTPRDKSTYSKIRTITKIPDEERRSSHVMQEYEYARVLAYRAKKIASGQTFSDLKSEDPIQIAKDEIANGKTGLKIRRFITETKYEEWAVSELLVLQK